ncbi:UDP-N-acetylmuramate dehydrogenase [Pigmentiphaga soli]|uniref:UDP-N-acetylenolpyruvoylglucosamine reductase n=1 Tax=Pigmentiphaga soli TaxID=1007095 RepID=A0ABP8HR89_9BURK
MPSGTAGPACGQDLTALNTLGLTSHAARYVRIERADALPALAAAAEAVGCGTAAAGRAAGLLLLGGGSNVVLPPEVPALVAHIALRGIRVLRRDAGGTVVEAAAGEPWHALVEYCVGQGWGGLENLALIPGTVGAAPVQNIGAYGVELADRFESLTAFDLQAGRWVEMAAGDCRFGYRDSVFKREPGRWAIAAVRLRLPAPWRPVLGYPDLSADAASAPGRAGIAPRDVFDAVCRIRRAKLPDPAVLGNAGSFFKNPVVDAATHDALKARFPDLVAYAQPGGAYKLAAGWLIDRRGWKGRRMGPAGVHERQALVLVNHGGARAADIMALAAAIQTDVQAAYGVWLEPEPVVVAGAGA